MTDADIDPPEAPMHIGNVAVDCTDVLRVAQFWSQALGRDLDGGSSPGWASIGGSDPDRREPAWYFSAVPESKQAKNRLHLDLYADDQGATIAELTARGASRAYVGQPADADAS